MLTIMKILGGFRPDLGRAVNDGPHPARPLDGRTDLSDNPNLKVAEFFRRLQKLARHRNVHCEFVADRGKGSHGRLYSGEEFTTLKDRIKEIGRDLLAKMCRDLRIDLHDL
jgi:mRNA interferase HicA